MTCSIRFARLWPYSDLRVRTRIPKVQNASLRYIFGLRKYNRISHKMKDLKLLNMKTRRQLFSVKLYHKIILTKAPACLLERLTFRTNVDNINIRHKYHITPPRHKTAVFQMSFSYDVYVRYNSPSSRLLILSVSTLSCAVEIFIYDHQRYIYFLSIFIIILFCVNFNWFWLLTPLIARIPFSFKCMLIVRASVYVTGPQFLQN